MGDPEGVPQTPPASRPGQPRPGSLGLRRAELSASGPRQSGPRCFCLAPLRYGEGWWILEGELAGGRACLESSAHPRGCGGRDLRLPPQRLVRRASRVWTRLMEGEPAEGRARFESGADPRGSGDRDLRLPLVAHPWKLNRQWCRARLLPGACPRAWCSTHPTSASPPELIARSTSPAAVVRPGLVGSLSSSGWATAAGLWARGTQRRAPRLVSGSVSVRLRSAARLPPRSHGDRPTAGQGPLKPSIAVRARVPVLPTPQPSACARARRGTPRRSSCACPRDGAPSPRRRARAAPRGRG